MRKSHWILVGFMLFNTACVVENAFPGWSALYASAREAAGSALDLVAAVTANAPGRTLTRPRP